MKIVVYTANIGNYDSFRNPVHIDPNVSYVLFTDDINFRSTIWDVRYVQSHSISSDPQRVARHFKLTPVESLPMHDVSVWIDSKYQSAISDFSKFVTEGLNGADMACYRHAQGNRSCLYDEALVCTAAKLDEEFIIHNQMSKYRAEGFPIMHGLFDTAVLVRRNNEAMNKFNEAWKKEVATGSKRDQLSQVYVSWKLGISISPIVYGGSVIYKSMFFVKHKHNHQIPRTPHITKYESSTNNRKRRRF